MSPALYDDIQAFLANQWGPLGGWCQAVVFAADLKPTVPKTKPSRSATPAKPSVSSRSLSPKVEVTEERPRKRTRRSVSAASSKQL